MGDHSAKNRGIEWSLRAFASIRAVRSFVGARVVINLVLRAASTLENKDGASGHHFVYFLLGGISLCCFAPSYLAYTVTLKQDKRPKARQDHIVVQPRHSQQLTSNYALLDAI